MTKHYQILNGSLGFNKNNRHWITIEKPLVVSKLRQISLMRNNPNAVLVEHLNSQQMCHYPVTDGHWINLPTRQGFTEIIPKGVRFDDQGNTNAVLIELVEIPVQQIFSQ